MFTLIVFILSNEIKIYKGGASEPISMHSGDTYLTYICTNCYIFSNNINRHRDLNSLLLV